MLLEGIYRVQTTEILEQINIEKNNFEKCYFLGPKNKEIYLTQEEAEAESTPPLPDFF